MRHPALLSATILLALAPLGAASQEGNGHALLAQPARLVARDTLLTDALSALQQYSGVSLAFSPDLLPPGRRVSCDCGNATVGEALRHILRSTGLAYEATRTLVRIVPAPTAAPPSQEAGTLAGVVRDSVTGAPLAGATLRLQPGRSVVSGDDGRFLLVGVAPGTYQVAVTLLGWETRTLEGVEVRGGEATTLEVSLAPVVIPLGEIVVAPSAFGLLRENPIPGQAFTRREVEASPHLGSDLLRAMNRIPGISTQDISAKPRVRGAPDDQVLVLLDGLELYEPYHMKYWDGVMSVVDPEAVGGV